MITGELIMTAYSEATLKNSRRIFIIRGRTETSSNSANLRSQKCYAVEWNGLKPFHTPISLIGLNTSKTNAEML